MATYCAVLSIKTSFSIFLHNCDAALPPECLKIFEYALKELETFQDFVERLDSRSRKRMNASLERVTKELLKFRDDVLHSTSTDFNQFVEDIHSLIKTLKKIEEEHWLLEDEEEVVSSSLSSSSKMVGLYDERRELKEALVDSSVDPYYLLLHGMAGIGKTTLAREVFKDLDILEWFECRAWVRVGLDRKLEEFKEAILAQLNPDAHKMVMEGDQAKKNQQLKELLTHKRCLIVLDDVWDDYKIDIFLLRFGAVGSRVVVTSRINCLHTFECVGGWYVIEKQLLNKEESWDLLREKAFSGGSCPPQLEDAGKKIAEKCDGLPLTIVTVADLLSKAEESLWIDVAAQRKHQIFIDAYDQISKVLYPSYKELRYDFKLCFLYMGVFPLKYEIPRTKLINLWTSEKIFEPIYNPDYRHDLESLKCLDFCSLVKVYQRSTTYFSDPLIQAIRTIGLHSSWWHFCQREARKTNFFHVIDFPEDGLEEGIKGQSRLSIHHNVLFARKDVYNSIEENCASTAQSLLCFGRYHQYQVPICFGLKLLRRLDALNIRFYDFPLEVVKLVKLRYLALTCNGKLPPSISKLRRLQYLTVHPHLSIKSRGALSLMPMEIWDLKKLKYLQVVGSDLPDSGDKSLGMLSTLLDVSTASCTVLNRLPNLKKLKIRIELTSDAIDPLCFSDHISNLNNLKSLKCIIVNPEFKIQVVPPVASFPVLPSSLKKLSLSGLGYPWEKMREISLLPSLQQLRLQFNAFQGQNWKVERSRFPSLYFLLIEDVNLSIKHCYKLKEIRLLNLNKDLKIEVVDSNPLVEKSIKEIMLKESRFSGIDISVQYTWKSARATRNRRSAFRKY